MRRTASSPLAISPILDEASSLEVAVTLDDSSELTSTVGVVDPRNQLNALTGREWIQATKSIWFQKGLGQGHLHAQIEREHPAPFSYQDVQRLIEFFTKPRGVVLDPFLGVGSTLKASALSGRSGIGIELSGRWAEASRRRLAEEVPSGLFDGETHQTVLEGDARELIQGISRSSVDFVVTSPPYWGILNKPADHKVKRLRLDEGLAKNYSDDIRDLANYVEYGAFLEELGKVFAGCYRVLRPGKYMAVIVGDFRHKTKYIPFHADVTRLVTEGLADVEFELSGITILVQNAKRLFPYGYPFAFVPNVHHQYVLIFRKRA
jgi:DNA modification methylase